MEENHQGISLQSVAARAEVGTTTAYRYFSSLDELLRAYMAQILETLHEFSDNSDLDGVRLFHAVMRRWVDLVLEHGRVMVQLRSRSGFLERLDRGDAVIDVSRRSWERPLAGLLTELQVPHENLRQALFLCNVLSDPREILDLYNTDKLTPDDITDRMTAFLSGAIRGWDVNDRSGARQGYDARLPQ
ncbi:TetR/AcrR family transcriptional regulator [Arthrobacter sp. MAHUQ-56]